jgi:hypothetical protein
MSDILIGVIVFGLVFGAAIFGMFLGRNLRALELCQELFLADGARSDEEDAVLQNLRTLLE